jgi:hypothetical protein
LKAIGLLHAFIQSTGLLQDIRRLGLVLAFLKRIGLLLDIRRLGLVLAFLQRIGLLLDIRRSGLVLAFTEELHAQNIQGLGLFHAFIQSTARLASRYSEARFRLSLFTEDWLTSGYSDPRLYREMSCFRVIGGLDLNFKEDRHASVYSEPRGQV